MEKGFVYLDAVVPGVFWDAKYAGSDNFTGSPVTGYRVNRVVGTLELAEALIKAAHVAGENGFALFLWDGYRPQRAVDCFLRWVNLPEDGKTKGKHYPNIEKRDMVSKRYIAEKSGHSRGSAIDLTLCAPDGGRLLDMGGGFDLMDIRSHHGAEGISLEASRNRQTLREIMEQCGFLPYVQEWWHYSFKNEPYPDQYFDFPIE